MYREVTMIEFREVLRLWQEQVPKKRIAARLGLDPKTVRRYLSAAEAAGLRAQREPLSDEQVRDLWLALQPSGGRPHGEDWTRCSEQREVIQHWLVGGLRLTKIRKLLARQGVSIAYPRLCRFVYPTFEETTTRAIEACEAAWQFYGGIFRVLIPDNTKALIVQPDALTPHVTPAFLEYTQARKFHVDPARVRHPRDKARVERAVSTVRDDCFAGEVLPTLDDASVHACHWCCQEYGLLRHSRTQRPPREHFEAEEQSVLLPVPTTPYEIGR